MRCKECSLKNYVLILSDVMLDNINNKKLSPHFTYFKFNINACDVYEILNNCTSMNFYSLTTLQIIS